MSTEKLFDSCYDANELQAKKVEAFDKIADMFYNRNFGVASKTEIELLMFNIFMDGMIHKYSNHDNVKNSYSMAPIHC